MRRHLAEARDEVPGHRVGDHAAAARAPGPRAGGAGGGGPLRPRGDRAAPRRPARAAAAPQRHARPPVAHPRLGARGQGRTDARCKRAVRAGGQRRTPPNRTAMHNRQLHGALAAFAEEAAWQLAAETADGAEIPFEVVARRAPRQPAVLLPPADRRTSSSSASACSRGCRASCPPCTRCRGLRPPGRLPRVARRARLSAPSRAPAPSSPCASSSAASSRTRPTSR